MKVERLEELKKILLDAKIELKEQNGHIVRLNDINDEVRKISHYEYVEIYSPKYAIMCMIYDVNGENKKAYNAVDLDGREVFRAWLNSVDLVKELLVDKIEQEKILKK